MRSCLRAPVLALAVVLGGCGGSGPGTAEPPTDTTPPTSTSTAPKARSAPRWETVTTISAAGPQRGAEFGISAEAIQWRVRWSCETGNLRITSTPPPRKGGPLVDAGCPGNGEAFSIHTGQARLDVESSGPWKAIVDQQVDTPTDEPLPPEAMSAPVVAQGAFYAMERQGKGTALVYRLADGRRILRLEGFEVSHNTDLFVWLSEAPRPKTSAEAVAAPKVSIGNLKSTLGNQNYDIPASVPTERIRSIVIWCEPVAIAYLAASLGPQAG